MIRRECLRAGAAVLGLAAAGLSTPAWARILNGFDLRDALVPMDAIEGGGPPRDGIPAIDRPRFTGPATSGLDDGDRVLGLMFDVRHPDGRLPLKAWVMGLVVGGHARAYPFDWLARKADAQGRWFDQLGGQRIRVQYDRRTRSAEAFDAAGRPLPTITAFWFAWVAFHPGRDLPTAP